MDFSKLKWQIFPVDKPLPAEIYEVFKEYLEPIAKEGIQIDAFIRFVVLCYAKESPLIEIEDIVMRKKKALELIQYTDPLLLEPITNETIGYAIIQFLKFENSPRHKTYMIYQETMCKYQMDLMQSSSKDGEKVINGIERLQQAIDNLSVKHFKGDAEVEAQAESFEVIAQRKIFAEEQ